MSTHQRTYRPAAAVTGALAITALATLGMPAATAAPTAVSGATIDIAIRDFAFSQPLTTVATGDSVTWTNVDKAPHDATSTSGPAEFGSGTLSTGQTYTHTFTVPGTYAYICEIHPNMKATIIASGPAVDTPQGGEHAHEATAEETANKGSSAPAKETTSKETAAKESVKAPAKEQAKAPAETLRAKDTAKAPKEDLKDSAKNKVPDTKTVKATQDVTTTASKAAQESTTAVADPATAVFTPQAPAAAPAAADETQLAAAGTAETDFGPAVLGGGLALAGVVLSLLIVGMRGRPTS
ncbi:MAG: plastocyanin/azurin family copper-binding protein [Sporichthyaceae bacterium]